ncbi:DNA photolyase [Lasiodiplodia theobromae]|uniref:DNA photolyase n=1 Tax=Lasiodiplodia theobromae TaxID=45133 RepID=UPI0015C30C0C|nr:DNA photolyase [Lasiodiplodia theobromae]KAF4539735.1 DNA photolyase [Lasiodiplodia theobromae]
MAKSKAPRVIYWHRTDLRLHDSPALHAALDLKPECLWQIWTWDSHYVYHARVGPNRWQFLLDSQRDLSARITALNPTSRLLVLREPPQTLFPKLFRSAAWRPTHLVYELDTDAYARERDAAVADIAREAGVEVVTRPGRTLFEPDALVEKNGGKPTMSMAQVQAAVKALGVEVPRPLPVPERLPGPPGGGGEVVVDFEQERPGAVPDLNAGMRGGGEGGESEEKTYACGLAGPKGDFGVPEMSELGLADDAAATTIRGGETRALETLRKVLDDVEYVATFEKPVKAPTEWDPPATTVLSPHLHFGTLGVREFWWGVKDAVEKYEREGKKKGSGMPVNLEGQLLFREMYFAAQAPLGHRFAQSHNNPRCRHIPWHLPSKIDPTTNLIKQGSSPTNYTIDSPEAEHWFQRWKAGATGFPWIDALMRQLRQTGWVEHLGRHALACFLTRGGCYVHWERGAEVFEEFLVDHEVACNAGNWMWLSCAAFFAQFYRCYSPVAFPKKWDKEGAFVRRWIPELENYDKKYIYEPWKAPIADQKRWGCRVEEYDEGLHGGDKGKEGAKSYPKPMFDFNERRQICIDAIKKAYDVGLYGDDQRVLDGTWKELFDDDAEGATSGAPKQEYEIDDGEGEVRSDNTEEKQKNTKGKGGTAKAGQKRQSSRAGQGTLDGIVKKSKKK